MQPDRLAIAVPGHWLYCPPGPPASAPTRHVETLMGALVPQFTGLGPWRVPRCICFVAFLGAVVRWGRAKGPVAAVR